MLSGRRKTMPPWLAPVSRLWEDFPFSTSRGSQARDRRTGVETWVTRHGAWLLPQLRVLPGVAVRYYLGMFGSINAHLLAFRLLSMFSTTLTYMRPFLGRPLRAPFLRKSPFRSQDIGRHPSRILIPPLSLTLRIDATLGVSGWREMQLTQ